MATDSGKLDNVNCFTKPQSLWLFSPSAAEEQGSTSGNRWVTESHWELKWTVV